MNWSGRCPICGSEETSGGCPTPHVHRAPLATEITDLRARLAASEAEVARTYQRWTAQVSEMCARLRAACDGSPPSAGHDRAPHHGGPMSTDGILDKPRTLSCGHTMTFRHTACPGCMGERKSDLASLRAAVEKLAREFRRRAEADRRLRNDYRLGAALAYEVAAEHMLALLR